MCRGTANLLGVEHQGESDAALTVLAGAHGMASAQCQVPEPRLNACVLEGVSAENANDVLSVPATS